MNCLSNSVLRGSARVSFMLSKTISSGVHFIFLLSLIMRPMKYLEEMDLSKRDLFEAGYLKAGSMKK